MSILRFVDFSQHGCPVSCLSPVLSGPARVWGPGGGRCRGPVRGVRLLLLLLLLRGESEAARPAHCCYTRRLLLHLFIPYAERAELTTHATESNRLSTEQLALSWSEIFVKPTS